MQRSHIHVLCVDDHRIVREGIALLINRQPDMKVVAAAATCDEAIELFRRHRPDVTIMDLQLGVMSGLDAIRAIRSDDVNARVIVLTMFNGEEDIHRALEAGADAYLVKDTVSADLIRVVRDVHAGKAPPISSEVQARLVERSRHPALSTRERQVIELISHGMRNKEIAAALGISEETVQVYVKKILAKLNVQDRTAALSVALKRGIIHLSEDPLP